MKKSTNPFRKMAGICLVALLFLIACTDQTDIDGGAINNEDKMSDENTAGGGRVSRGEYLASIASCGDCYSPKNFTEMGPVDSTRLLSGHPANSKLPAISKDALKPDSWALMAHDGTTFVGPWGVSFSANITSDSATGIGAWTEEVFINTLRTGKHLGQPAGRPILPPMPWYFIARMTDDDLKSLYAYLQSLPPINNKVPAPLSPDEALKLAAK